MKLIRITAIAALFFFAPIINTVKAEPDVQTAQTTDVYETRSAVIVGINTGDTTSAYVIQDEETGTIYLYNFNGAPAFGIGDHVCVTTQKPVKGNIIIRDIIRK